LTGTVFNTANRTKGTVTFAFPHLLQNSACASAAIPSKWNNAAVCGSTATIRQVMFRNLIKL
jgi:hypothetical protein